MATVGALIFEMSANVARLQSDMASAQSTVKGAMDSIGSAVNTAKAAFAALGVSLGVHELVSFVESGIESVAMLDRLAKSTGLTVETLSALRTVAAESHTNLDAVATMVAKLDKNMLDFAQNGTGRAAKAFEALGYSQDQVREGLKNLDGFLPEFAQRLIAAGEGGETVGLTMQLIGKGASGALPFLYALADAQQLVATRTAEQAAHAKELEAELAKVSEGSKLLKEDLAIGLTPALMQTVQAFNDLRARGEGAVQLGETLGTVLRYVANVAASLWIAFKDLGNAVGALVAQMDALAHLDFAAFKAIGEERDRQLIATNATLDALNESLTTVKEMAPPHEVVTQAMKDQLAAALATAAALQRQQEEQDVLDRAAAKRMAQQEEIDRQSDAMQPKVQKVNDLGKELGMTFQSAFENAVVGGKNLSDVLKGIDEDVARIIIRQTISAPLAGAISKAVTDSGFSFGGGKAAGGPVSPGMSYLVGENGPEVLNMGASSGNITPNGGGGPTYIDARGADQGAVARLEMGLRQLHASIEYRSVAAVQRAFNLRGALTPMG